MFKPLTNLNANRARIAVLDTQIRRLKALAHQLENDVSIRGVTFGEKCRHAEGGHSDPTGRAAVQPLPEDVQQLYQDIRSMIIERQRVAVWVELAEQALAFLPERQRIIVQARIVDGLSWEGVVDALYDQTGQLLSDKSCRANFKRAIAKIKPFFTVEDIGANFDGAQGHNS